MVQLALALSILAATWLVPGRAAALPDLTPEIYGLVLQTNQTVDSGDVLDGCAATTSGRTLVRFGVRTWNVGADPLVLGATGCPDCTTSPTGAMCTNPDFECSPSGVPRAVFLSSSTYELLDMTGNQVAIGLKHNYCFHDDCVPTDQRTFNDCQNNQGVSVGCFDDYEPDLACQYIDATDVPGITTKAFRVRVTIDPKDLLPDANRGNNVTEMVLPGCGDGVLQPGEQCDPGTQTAGTCCDASCHLLPAGTTCRSATGACDAAGVCDGSSPACPADASLPDGTPCGSGAVGCSTGACQGGTCQVQQEPGCSIAGSCVPAGAADPSDACQHCDPSESTSAWSPIQDASAQGIQCGLAAASGSPRSATCPKRVSTALDHQLGRAQTIAGRLATAKPGAARRLTTRLLRMVNRSIRMVGPSTSCSSDALRAALEGLREQIQTMQASGKS
jgi:cysteine-rich repeat protein